jgi:hypothetical protein
VVPDWVQLRPARGPFLRRLAGLDAAAHRVFAHWALDIRDYEHQGAREVGFIPRPLHPPAERLFAPEGISVHALMDRIEALDREVGLPFGWFFLMTHGHWVDPDVGQAIAVGLRAERVRLPDCDAEILLRWAERSYGF